LEIVCRDYSKKNEDGFLFYAIEIGTKEVLVQQQYRGVGSNPYVPFRWSKCSGEIYGRGPLLMHYQQSKQLILQLNLSLRMHRWLSLASTKWKMTV
jgi:hypothetical protein